jgi:ferric-dicitrate binding protein FerR (iron transport regulator)
MRSGAIQAMSMLALLAALSPRAATAEPGAVGVVTTLQGSALVQRAALSAPMRLSFKDDVFSRDRISTGEGALVRVLLGGKAVVTVRELSVLAISEQGGRAVVLLDSGAVTASVAHSRLRPGESIEIRTRNAVAAVRGTVLTVEAGEAAAGTPGDPAVPLSRIRVLSGSVEVSASADPAAATVLVGARQQVSVSGNTIGAVQPAPALAAAAQSGPAALQHDAPPDPFVDALAARENGRALGLAHSILRPDPGAGGQRQSNRSAGGESPLQGDKALGIFGGPDADGRGGAGRGNGGGMPDVPLTATSRGNHGRGHP